MVADAGVWLYAVTAAQPRPPSGLTGVAGEEVRTVGAAGLAAVVGSVGLDEFGEEPLRRKLNDLASLEAVARAHHEVVEAVTRLGAAVPARLATVYRDDAGVAAMLVERREALLDALARLAGHVEMGVKAFQAASVPDAALERPADLASPGLAYLQRRRAQLSAAEDARRAAAAGAEDVHATLGRLATATRQHAPQDPRLSGSAGPMVFNGAYLVDDDRVDTFAAAVRELAARHRAVRLELTGPWPPYSFAAQEEVSR